MLVEIVLAKDIILFLHQSISREFVIINQFQYIWYSCLYFVLHKYKMHQNHYTQLLSYSMHNHHQVVSWLVHNK